MIVLDGVAVDASTACSACSIQLDRP